MSTLVDKSRYFWKPVTCTNVLDQVWVEHAQMCYKNKKCEKNKSALNFNIFTHFPSVAIFSCVNK